MTLNEWLAARIPPVPGDFRSWMEPSYPTSDGCVEALVREAEVALQRALDGVSRPRRGAFDLLAADAFLTYACEAAVEGLPHGADAAAAVDEAPTTEPGVVLDELIRRFGA